MRTRLVERAREGDDVAFAELVDLDGDRCYAIAYRILRDVERAQDAVQQALLLAWRELPRLRDAERFEVWLHRLVATINADVTQVACYPPSSLWLQTTIDSHAATLAFAGCNEHFYFARASVVVGNRVWFFDLDGPDRSLIVPFLSTVTIDPAAVVD